jgi:hypothetical protein
MATVVYPYTLTAGQPENVNQLNSNLSALTAQVNGNLDATNIAHSTLGDYRTVFQAVGFGTGLGSGTVLPTASGGVIGVGGSSANAPMVFQFDPTHYSVSGLSTMLRMSVWLGVNGTAPAVNFTFGLYPVSNLGGGAGVFGVSVLGAVVSGSTAVINAPASTSATGAVSSDFAAPTAGAYVPAVVLSGSQAANSAVSFTWMLQRRYT